MDEKRKAFESYIEERVRTEGCYSRYVGSALARNGDDYLHLTIQHEWMGWKARGEYERGQLILGQLSLRMDV